MALPTALAPLSQTVSAISCKIVTGLKVLYLLNGIAKGPNNQLGKYGLVPGLQYAILRTSIALSPVNRGKKFRGTFGIFAKHHIAFKLPL